MDGKQGEDLWKIFTVDTDTMTGTSKSGEKNAEMVKHQQELIGQINESRLDIGKHETEEHAANFPGEPYSPHSSLSSSVPVR